MVRIENPNRDMDVYQPDVTAPWASEGSAAGAAGHQSLWSIIDDRMRGRWKWAAMLGLVLAVTLGLLGYDSAEPLYTSTGAIRIVTNTPVVRTPTFEGTKTPAEVATQIEYIKGDRVLRHALEDEQLKALPFGKFRGAMGTMRNGLDVKPLHDSELVLLTFAHEDPKVAQAVVNAVLHSYYEIYGKNGGAQINSTLKELTDHVETAEREQRRVRNDLGNIYKHWGNEELRELQKTKSGQIAELEKSIATMQRALRRMEGDKANGGQDEAIEPPMAELVKLVPNLAELRHGYDEAENRFETVKLRGYKPGSFLYDTSQQQLEAATRLFEQAHANALERWRRSGGDALLAGGGALEGAQTPEKARDRLKELNAEFERMKAENQQLTGDIQTVADLKNQEDRILQDVKDTQKRIDDLKLESPSLAKSITIEQEGYLPEEPSSDARTKRGIAGLSMGLLGSFGLFFLWGTMDRRAYGARQLHVGSGAKGPPCLGVLPDLGRTLRDQETSEVAAHCVHQIRNQIEARRDVHEGYVLAVSSPFQGDGKTSIVMALGWSYAAAGFETLVIDCDMVGRSLTRQLGLVGHEGVKDALQAQVLNGSVVRMPLEHLSALPVGVDSRFGPENLKRSDLDRLLAQLRGKYDILLIDTGPMLGSLESTPVTAAADGVVLSVRRGRSRTRLDECVSRLETVGAPCLGVILNYAVRSDCNRYVSEASLAAAVDSRESAPDEPRVSLNRSSVAERNPLVLVMEQSSRPRGEPDESTASNHDE